MIAAPGVTVLLILLRLLGWLQPLELAALDQLFRLRPPEPPDPRVVIVGIQETDIQRLQHWPPSDAVIAQVVQKLKRQQPAAIGLTLYRDFPVEPGHRELKRIFTTTPNLIGIEKRIGSSTQLQVKPPPLLSKFQQVGINDMVIDPDGRLRRSLLYLASEQQGIAASLGLRLALIYLGQRGIFPDSAAPHLRLGKAEFIPFEGHDGGYARVDAGGYQVLLNFRQGATPSFATVSLTDVLTDRVGTNWATGRIVLIGAIAPSLNDDYLTPYNGELPVAGVEIHAQIVSQIISAALEGRSLLRVWDEPWEWLWVFAWTTVGATLCWRGRYQRVLFQQLGIISLLAGLLLELSLLAFWGGWWMPVVSPLLGLVGGAIAITYSTARTATRLRNTFGRYLSDAVVASLLETPDGLNLGGKRQRVTVLMADLRGFSSSAERVPPEQVVAFLNCYLETMTDVISQYQGTINEFLGDGILVIFGAPQPRPDDAERAIACALAMQRAMPEVNQHRALLGLAVVEMGIGIHTGEGVVGNIGSVKRAKYGVVGSHINLAARIESHTVGGQILISDATRLAIQADLFTRGQMQVRLKGFNQLFTLWEVGGLGSPFNLILPEPAIVLGALPAKVPVHYTVLDEPYLRQQVFQGSLTKLSEREAELQTDTVLAAWSNIKIDLLGLTPLDDLYAKVLDIPGSNARFLIRFTALSATSAAILRQLQPK